MFPTASACRSSWTSWTTCVYNAISVRSRENDAIGILGQSPPCTHATASRSCRLAMHFAPHINSNIARAHWEEFSMHRAPRCPKRLLVGHPLHTMQTSAISATGGSAVAIHLNLVITSATSPIASGASESAAGRFARRSRDATVAFPGLQVLGRCSLSGTVFGGPCLLVCLSVSVFVSLSVVCLSVMSVVVYGGAAATEGMNPPAAGMRASC